MKMNNWNGRLAACTVLALFATSTYSFPASLSAQQPDATSPAVTFRKIMNAPAEFDDALWFWDLQSLKATGPKLAHDWCWDLGFSSDGKWLFTRSHRQVRVRNGRSGEPVAGPFRHDLIEGGFAYDPRSQRLVTFENNSEDEASWSSAAVIRAGQDWPDTKRINLSGHTRKARWIDDRHLLVISDVKQPGEQPPHTYDKTAVSIIILEGDQPEIQRVTRHRWIRDAAVTSDASYVIVTTRDWTSCWQLDETEPIWTKPAEYSASLGDGDWVLLHRGENASICSLATGEELRQWDNIVASRRDGATVWLCSAKGIEVWKAENE